MAITERETDFTTDKYGDPVYLSKRESVAQIVRNALFMKRGNNISHPDRFVDIEQYLGKPDDVVDELKILADLKRTIGDMVGNEVQSLTFNTVTDENGDDVAFLMVRLVIDNTQDLMGIAIRREHNQVIRYKYNFINEDVPI